MIFKRIIPSGLTFFFSLFIFIILLSTTVFMAFVSFVLLKKGIMPFTRESSLFMITITIIIVSTVVGTVFSLIIGRFPLRPIKEIVNATNQLAEGDFSARLNLPGPDEFKEINKSFNRMAEELGSIEILRSDFVNNFSHEFKTPIVSLRGFAKLLKSKDLTEEERDEYLDIIISESERLSRLSTNVLNLSKIENQTIITEKSTFNISEQIRRDILIFEPRWIGKNINLTVDMEELSYRGNEELLSEVWLNLIDNAIKFTPDGGNIQIKLLYVDDALFFKIKDSGKGIAAETAEHIFDKFYQGDTSHASEGNGLGLALAIKIVELHGGNITLKSKENNGCEFTVCLPCQNKSS